MMKISNHEISWFLAYDILAFFYPVFCIVYRKEGRKNQHHFGKYVVARLYGTIARIDGFYAVLAHAYIIARASSRLSILVQKKVITFFCLSMPLVAAVVDGAVWIFERT
jgi:hypothetical protein